MSTGRVSGKLFLHSLALPNENRLKYNKVDLEETKESAEGVQWKTD